MYLVKDNGDRYDIYYAASAQHIGFVRKSDLLDAEKFEKVLCQVVLKTLSVSGSSSKKNDSSTLGSDLFHICAAGVFEK